MRLAWGLFAATVVLLIAVTVLTVANDFAYANDWGTGASGIVGGGASVAFGLCGALIAARQPRNAVGWICLAIGVGIGLNGLASQSAVATGEPFFAWFGNWDYNWFVALLAIYLPLLFPSGRLPGPRWRILAWVAGAAVILVSVASALYPGPLPSRPDQDNPFGVGPESLMEALQIVAGLAYFASILAAGASMVVRFRRSTGVERAQLKWFAYAAAAIAATFVPLNFVSNGEQGARVAADLVTVAFAGLPAAAGVAILRHRLYDIDVVIRRTLTYGALTAALVATYLLGVLLLQLVLPARSDLAVAGSTLAVAAVFGPARARIQALVDRRFFRARYDAARTLETFGSRLRDEVSIDAIDAELRATVATTVQPAHVSVWLRP